MSSRRWQNVDFMKEYVLILPHLWTEKWISETYRSVVLIIHSAFWFIYRMLYTEKEYNSSCDFEFIPFKRVESRKYLWFISFQPPPRWQFFSFRPIKSQEKLCWWLYCLQKNNKQAVWDGIREWAKRVGKIAKRK